MIRLVAGSAGTEKFRYLRGNGFIDHFVNQLVRILRVDDFVAIGIDDLALVVHHVVEIEGAFAREIVALLDAFLRRLDRLVEPAMFQFLALLEAEALHDFRHPIGRAEVAHEIVLEADVETGRARIALARATAAQLPIDAPRFVTLCADDVEAAFVRHAGAEFNVSPAAGHVSRNGDGARLARRD